MSSCIVEQAVDHLRRGGGVVGAVAVDQHIDVGLDVGEHAAHDIALALQRLAADDRAGGAATCADVSSVELLS